MVIVVVRVTPSVFVIVRVLVKFSILGVTVCPALTVMVVVYPVIVSVMVFPSMTVWVVTSWARIVLVTTVLVSVMVL